MIKADREDGVGGEPHDCLRIFPISPTPHAPIFFTPFSLCYDMFVPLTLYKLWNMSSAKTVRYNMEVVEYFE
jgi:hypothetical protein